MALPKETLEEVAVIVQFVSMFLEIVGIGLAFIELRYRSLAIKLENWIGVADHRVRDLAYKFVEHKSFSTLVTLFVFFIFVLEIPTFFGFWDELPSPWDSVAFYLQLLALPILLVFFLGVFLILLSAWITSLHKFSNGHAIGALGVFIASMGLVGELYQVIIILSVSKGA